MGYNLAQAHRELNAANKEAQEMLTRIKHRKATVDWSRAVYECKVLGVTIYLGNDLTDATDAYQTSMNGTKELLKYVQGGGKVPFRAMVGGFDTVPTPTRISKREASDARIKASLGIL